MATASDWPGQLLSTSRGPVFVRHNPDAEPGHPPLLFVHGLGGESLDWADVAADLGGTSDCYALDLPGFANSLLPADGDLSLDGHVRTIAEIARLIGPPVHLVGNSMGGAVALRVAAEHPELVSSLSLLSPALPDLRPRFGSAQLTVAVLPVVGPMIVRAVMRADPEWMAKRVYTLCYGDPAAVSADRHAHELAALRRRAGLAHSPLVYRSSIRTMVGVYLDRGPRRLWRQAPAVAVPTLVIYGERDRLVGSRVAVRAQRTIPDAVLLRLPYVGHVAHLEVPAAVAAALRLFLARSDLIRGMSEPHGTVVDVRQVSLNLSIDSLAADSLRVPPR
ncbi:MAG TPA: alpha/beta hydrolase [Acidothermaceae bacterium]